MISGINTASDISKLLDNFEISSGFYAKYHVQIMLLFVVIIHSKYFPDSDRLKAHV